MLHDEKIYPKPEEFIPERWTTQPELVLNKAAYLPFSTGKLENYPHQQIVLYLYSDICAMDD